MGEEGADTFVGITDGSEVEKMTNIGMKAGQSVTVIFAADPAVSGEIEWVDDWGLAVRQWNDAVLFIPWNGTIAYVEVEAKELGK